MNYKIRKQLTPDQRLNYAGISDTVAHLLFHRGVSNEKDSKRFISPEYESDNLNPSLLKDADKAAVRFIQAVTNNEKIAIYSDYDADGIPGAAMFHDFLKRIGYSNFIVYIPHRHNEGFGLNKEAVDELASGGVKLLITIDCGIADFDAVKHANGKGMTVIITDHHEPPGQLPEAFAIIDHKQADCPYPDKNICGTGVAYKFIQAILAKNRFGLKEGMEKWLLDLVGIATLSDMVPLTGENRVFSYYGLNVLRKSPRKGIRRLLAKLNISQSHLNEDDIAFMITPRINAASRMGVPMDAFNLLIADNDEDADKSAEHLDKINTERKGVVASLVKEVKKVLHKRHGQDSKSFPGVLVLGNPEWRPSLLGLVANTCAEEFDRPVFLWGRDGDNAIKGSCRSEGRTNIVQLMRAAPVQTFTQFGGHKHSGGFAVHNDQIHFLEQNLNDAQKRSNDSSGSGGIDSNLIDPLLCGTGDELKDKSSSDDQIDLELSLDDVSYALFDDINKLAPFGTGNPKPVFLFKDIVVTEIRNFGKAKDHVELVFKKNNGGKVSAISFFGGESEWAKSLKNGDMIDLIAHLEKSMFRGRAELRLRVVEVIKSNNKNT